MAEVILACGENEKQVHSTKQRRPGSIIYSPRPFFPKKKETFLNRSSTGPLLGGMPLNFHNIHF